MKFSLIDWNKLICLQISQNQTRQVEELSEIRKVWELRRNDQQREINEIADKQGYIITDMKLILKITEHFYADLYQATTQNTGNIQNRRKRISAKPAEQ